MTLQEEIRAKRDELMSVEAFGKEWHEIGDELRALERKAEMQEQAKDQVNAYQDEEGVWRWKSNNQVPFKDMLEAWNLDEETMQKCIKAREKDDDEFFAAYEKQMENHVHTPEELYEMEAAFGKGAEVVNVITGKVTKL